MANQQEKKPQTLVINNFTGSLSRAINGDMNSGFAKFYSSWGYNPFASPGNLTWNQAPYNATLTLDGLAVAGKVRLEANGQFLYVITNTGHLVKIFTTTTAQTDLHTLTTGSPTFNYGASMEFFNGKIWISNDKGLSRIDFDGTNETQVGTWDSSHFIQNTYHPLTVFQGKLLIGNTTDGTTTNFGTIDGTNLIINYNTISPALPQETFIRDMDITSDFSYLVVSASAIGQENLSPGNDRGNAASGDSFLFRWNGSDVGITSGISLPNFGITALNNFGDTEFSFLYDSIGVSLYQSGKKILSVPDNKSPLPNAVSATGNLITWACPEVERQLEPAGQTSLNSMYFYGQLDESSPVGLWRMFRQQSDLTNGSVNEVPFMCFTNNQYLTIHSDGSVEQIPALQYFSRQEFTTGSPTNQLFLFSYSVGIGGAVTSLCGGVYETQTQLFSKKISISQVRVYCSPTAATNSFQLDLIGMDGTPMDNGTFTYTYVAGDNITSLEGALTRINFNPSTETTFGLGIRITNLDTVGTTTNMLINKIEVDYSPEGQ